MSSTFEHFKDILVKRFDAEKTHVTPDAAIADIGLDSLTLMEFIFAAEDHLSGHDAFDVPSIQSYELRRQLESK